MLGLLLPIFVILTGIACIALLFARCRKRCEMPTDQEVKDLTNRLNRMALKRGSK